MRALSAVLLLLLACAGPALAHKGSDSYLELAFDGLQVQGRWDIALGDLDDVTGLDADGDGDITWGEVRTRHAQLAAYALQRLAVSQGGAACDLAAPALAIATHTDGAYASFTLAGRCAASGAIEVRYGLLFDVDPRHRGLARIERDGEVRSVILSPEQPSLALRGADGGLLRTLLAFGRDGVHHILTGYDHLLFLMALLLPVVVTRRGPRWAIEVVAVVTAFTVAHSITLSLGALRLVSLPGRWVETAIAATVLLAALDNLVPFLPRRRWLVAFAFGLVHGLGFASVLQEMDLPAHALVASLLGFNLGVEAGQLAVVAIAVPLLLLLARRWHRAGLAAGVASAAIAALAIAWIVERAFLLPLPAA